MEVTVTAMDIYETNEPKSGLKSVISRGEKNLEYFAAIEMAQWRSQTIKDVVAIHQWGNNNNQMHFESLYFRRHRPLLIWSKKGVCFVCNINTLNHVS